MKNIRLPDDFIKSCNGDTKEKHSENEEIPSELQNLKLPDDFVKSCKATKKEKRMTEEEIQRELNDAIESIIPELKNK